MKIVKSTISKYYAISLELAKIDTLMAVKNNYFDSVHLSSNSAMELGERIGEFQGGRLEFYLNELENEEALRKREHFFASNAALTFNLNRQLTSESLLAWLMEKPVESLTTGILSIEISEADAKPGDYILGCTFGFAAAFTALFEKYDFSEDFFVLFKKARQLHQTEMIDSANSGKTVQEIYHVQDEKKFSHNIFLVVHMLQTELGLKFSKRTICELIIDNILEFHKVPQK